MNVSQTINKKTICFAVALLAIGLFYFGNGDSSTVSSTETDDTYYEVNHAFTTAATNLIKETSTADKLETRLNKYDIASAINEVFYREGFKIETDINNHG